ncbi:DUF4347 domain-containing protein [Flavobacterium cerinum]|uniref:DUF4347 domain-containing protein n=1 Tax=Flavobacterium cerinum TaxID=2502784 RepID=A0ABY5IV51_9FLAO|nr:DUF4347 domain-containing protein [Flavobacterium cerinum]UUC46711.1 DUF4347 domain-containing protein [Flavobacterium cerinum]
MQNPINLIDPTGMAPEDGDPKRRNSVVIDGSKSDKHDKALKANKKAVQKLDSSVTVISAKSRKDMMNQISSHLEDSEKMGDVSILSHGNYDDTGFYIGKDYINTKSKMESLGVELAKYSDSDTNIAITACHLGAGHNPESSKDMLQILSNSTKANVFTSMTWGAATENRFNNSDVPYFFSDPTYTVFDKTPLSPVNYKDKELGKTRLNSIKNLGNTLYLRPNSNPKIIKDVYFTRTGFIKY